MVARKSPATVATSSTTAGCASPCQPRKLTFAGSVIWAVKMMSSTSAIPLAATAIQSPLVRDPRSGFDVDALVNAGAVAGRIWTRTCPNSVQDIAAHNARIRSTVTPHTHSV